MLLPEPLMMPFWKDGRRRRTMGKDIDVCAGLGWFKWKEGSSSGFRHDAGNLLNSPVFPVRMPAGCPCDLDHNGPSVAMWRLSWRSAGASSNRSFRRLSPRLCREYSSERDIISGESESKDLDKLSDLGESIPWVISDWDAGAVREGESKEYTEP